MSEIHNFVKINPQKERDLLGLFDWISSLEAELRSIIWYQTEGNENSTEETRSLLLTSCPGAPFVWNNAIEVDPLG